MPLPEHSPISLHEVTRKDGCVRPTGRVMRVPSDFPLVQILGPVGGEVAATGHVALEQEDFVKILDVIEEQAQSSSVVSVDPLHGPMH